MKMKVSLCISVALATLLLAGCGNRGKDRVDNIVSVKVMPIKAMTEQSSQSYAGTIEETSGTSLSFSGAGTIKTLHLSEGQKVSAGQELGTIDAVTSRNTLTAAHAATISAEEAVKQAEDTYRRMKMLHDNGSLAEMRWVEVETKVSQAHQMLRQARASEQIARKGLTNTRLTAPFGGYIVRKVAEVGQNVMPGQPVASLVKIDQVKVKLSVPEDEIARLSIGQQVRFRVASLGDASFVGKIIEKGVAADRLSRTYEVKALVQNSTHRLLPGMICEAWLIDDSTSKSISLPADIIQIDSDNRPFVWTVENGAAAKRYVTLGENVGENVIIAGGLASGDKIVVEGQQKVSNGTKVKSL